MKGAIDSLFLRPTIKLAIFVVLFIPLQAEASYCAGWGSGTTYCAETPIGACKAYYDNMWGGCPGCNFSILPTGGVGNFGDDTPVNGLACQMSSGGERDVYPLSGSPDIWKSLGCDKSAVGNPCNPKTGNKYLNEVDYSTPTQKFVITRTYNSMLGRDVGLGHGWIASPLKHLSINQLGTYVVVMGAIDRGEDFNCNASPCTGNADTQLALTKDASGYALATRNGQRETFDANGRLLTQTTATGQTTTYTYDTDGRLATIRGPHGHTLTYIWDTTNNRVSSITLPDSKIISYAYTDTNLTKVTYPDNTARIYHYENTTFPNHLTGISLDDGQGNVRRYATYAYDSNGKATLTQHADTGNGAPQEKFTFTYNSATQTTVTNAAGTQEVLTFAETLGVKNLVNKVMPDGKTLNQTFDANNNLTCKKDEEGRVTTYTYNTANQRTAMTEGQGGTCAAPTSTAATRTTTYQYVSTTLDAPTVIESPSVASGQVRRTTLTYGDTRFPTLPTAITQSGYTPSGSAVSRTVGLTYNASGQVLTLDGPRTDVSDVTTFTYNDCTTGAACGQLKTVTNALNQTTTYNSYDAHGRVTEMTDPNGLKTNYAYDLRGRVLSVTQTPSGGTARTTQYVYDDNGNVTEVTDPTGRKLTYTYDAAQYLRTVTDNLGNKISYSYDPRGNRTKEDVSDSSNTLVRTVETAHDIRNRITQINAAGSLTTLIHDAIGNLTQTTPPNQQGTPTPKSTTHEYDALNRLVKTIDTLGGNTTLAHTPIDAPASVTAPNAANTTYTHDDLGRRLTETSPDRGTTAYTHDPAGNVLTLTDARNITVTYTYDALNRMTKATYPDATLNVTYTHDSGTGCTHGIGRLCQVTDQSGTTQYAYDAYGNVTEHKKTELGVTYSTKYTYDNADRILTITYPDNRVATYTRDILGRITTVSFPVNGTATILTQDRTYRADGLLSTQTFGSGLTESRTYDQQGRMTNWTIGGETRTYTYDANSNVSTRTLPTESRTYVYDPEDRLTEDRVTAGSGTTNTLSYDLNGNRTQLNTTAYLYAATTNRLTQVGTKVQTLDPAGNTTKDNLNYNYVYYANGTLKEARSGTTLKGTYTYNHRFQRTRKVAGTATTVYHYDLEGNLLAETKNTGVLIRAYVHDDQAPIAQVTKGTTDTLAYLHTDQLNTPRLATNAARSIVWRHDGNAFGDSAITGSITVNLRFPGQYYDAETKLHYNHHRYYDPRIGRYVTSDPIGLEGGLNTYAYVDNNPTGWIDADGLSKTRGGGNSRSQPRPEQGGTTWWNGRQGSWVNGRFVPRLGETAEQPRIRECPTNNRAGYGVNDPPVRVPGQWSSQDIRDALMGRSPRGLGRPDLHHADQMPGSAIHEIPPTLHRGNPAIHPNKYNQGVTPEMRQQDKQLHWWYRAREQGADRMFPNHVYD